jgi:hypothetical protein
MMKVLSIKCRPGATADSHPNWSAAKWSGPATSLEGNTSGSIDFARDDTLYCDGKGRPATQIECDFTASLRGVAGGSGANKRSGTATLLIVLVFLCLLAFSVLGLLVVSPEILAARIDLDGRFLTVLVHNGLVTFLPLTSLFFDPKDLIASSFLLNGGLHRRWHVLHLDLRFLMFGLSRHPKREASADYPRCN